MPFNHLLLGLAVVFVWGTNFVVIRWGLDELPPFLLATLRFTLSALPWMLFMPRPAVPWSRLVAFGVLLGVGQFSLLFLAMRSSISPGMASLVIQMQVFFTIGLALIIWRESVRPYQVVGMLMAVGGLGVIASHLNATVTATGVLIVLVAALAWACANLVAKSVGRVNMLHFVVWSSAFAVPPLFALSWWLEGSPSVMLDVIRQTSATVWATVLWQAVGNTLFGYGVWNWLLSRHSAAAVTPMALLVPVFGMSASALALGEALQPWKLQAAALVLAGLGVIVLWPKLTQPRLTKPAAKS